jgi:hypothetical protein
VNQIGALALQEELRGLREHLQECAPAQSIERFSGQAAEKTMLGNDILIFCAH